MRVARPFRLLRRGIARYNSTQPGQITVGTAHLDYEVDADAAVMNITHTFVPPEMRGQGAAKQLCDAAYERARAEHLLVLPSCSYVSDNYAARNPDVHDVTLRSADAPEGLFVGVTWLGVATVRLTDARRRNPLTRAVLNDLRYFLRECASMDPSADLATTQVRAIVVSASGPVFSSGHDFRDFRGATRAEQRELVELCADVNALLGEVPQPTVAAVAGKCVAGGLQLAASCDLVLAREDATFCLPGVKTGGFCHTPAVALGARVAPRHALELALLGDEIDASDAHRIGLANRVVAASEWPAAVDATVAGLAQRFGKSMADGKRTFYEQLRQPALRERYAVATETMVEMFASEEYQSAMAAFLDRKKG